MENKTSYELPTSKQNHHNVKSSASLSLLRAPHSGIVLLYDSIYWDYIKILKNDERINDVSTNNISNEKKSDNWT